MLTRRSFSQLIGASFLSTTAARADQNADDFNIIGVDCHTYPGDDAVKFFSEKNSMKFFGFYLTHAPGNPDKTWLKSRDHLVQSGFGLLPTYLGSQNDSPLPDAGDGHGREAAKLMREAGFAQGSIVYLDVETPKPEGGLFQKYIEAWVKAVRADGYYPGIYGSYIMVPWLKKLTGAIWTVELPFGKGQITQIAGANASSNESLGALYGQSMLAYDPAKHPHGIIRPDCVATQYRWLVHVRDIPLAKHVRNEFDLSSSRVADPSDPVAVAKSLGVTHLP